MSGYQELGALPAIPCRPTRSGLELDTLSWTHGAHNIIAGLDLSRIFTTRFAANSPRGSFNFTGVNDR